MTAIIWSDYLQYRATLRGFDLKQIEAILRYSGERYYDVETGRLIAVGKHDDSLVLIPYEEFGDSITPVTVHATTRQQVRFRLKSGSLKGERYTLNESCQDELL